MAKLGLTICSPKWDEQTNVLRDHMKGEIFNVKLCLKYEVKRRQLTRLKKKRGQYGKHVSALLFLYYVTQQIHIVVEKNNTF